MKEYHPRVKRRLNEEEEVKRGQDFSKLHLHQLHLNYALFSSMKECSNHYLYTNPFFLLILARSLIFGSCITWSKLKECNPTAWPFNPTSTKQQLVLADEARIIFLSLLMIFRIYFIFQYVIYF